MDAGTLTNILIGRHDSILWIALLVSGMAHVVMFYRIATNSTRLEHLEERVFGSQAHAEEYFGDHTGPLPRMMEQSPSIPPVEPSGLWEDSCIWFGFWAPVLALGAIVFAMRRHSASSRPEYIDQDLMQAANNGNLEDVQTFLAKGATVDATNSSGDTALIIAAFNGHPEVVELLLVNGANIDAASSTGKTALMWAAYWGMDAIVELLISRGASLNMKNENGETALDMAEDRENKATVGILKAAGGTE